MNNIIDGRKIAESITNKIAETTHERTKAGFNPPGLAVVLVGSDPASEIYVKHKRKTCERLGFYSLAHNLSDKTTEAELLGLIEELNQDPSIHGILVQLPLPKTINVDKIIQSINPNKDVDGFHPYNIGCLAQRIPNLRPCTPYGIIKMLEYIEQPFKGQHAVVIGASNIVGRPVTLELLLAGATVTNCHRFTKDLAEHIGRADIVIAAAGKPGLVKGEWIPEGSIVIDVGVNRLENGKLCGDVEFEIAKEKAKWITPVPGGVGPMTIAMLMYNTLQAAELIDGTPV